jgi:cation transport ATPase
VGPPCACSGASGLTLGSVRPRQVAGAVAIGDYSEAASVVVLFGSAEFLEGRCSGQARDAIAAVLSLKPATAVLVHSGEGHKPPEPFLKNSIHRRARAFG